MLPKLRRGPKFLEKPKYDKRKLKQEVNWVSKCYQNNENYVISVSEKFFGAIYGNVVERELDHSSDEDKEAASHRNRVYWFSWENARVYNDKNEQQEKQVRAERKEYRRNVVYCAPLS